MKSHFTKKLLEWNKLNNTRVMPWKGEKDPYRIWLSEIILQQTRVEQGLAYYNRFINVFPTVHHLANAPEQEIFKLWEGLGYYSRCKNLIETAKFISERLQGRFPDNYKDVRALKGIGPYTAAAITSFAFNLPHAVIDGNVLRVLSRYYDIETPVDNTAGKILYNKIADELLDKDNPAVYNQAVMDFGAMICKAQLPLCNICIQQNECRAFKNNRVKILPVKEKKIIKKKRWFYYFIVEHQDKIFIRKRSNKDIWQNLYEFVLIEADNELPNDKESFKKKFQSLGGPHKITVNQVSKVYRQQLTHQTIVGQFITVSITEPEFLQITYKAVFKNDLTRYPFPKIIANWLLENQTM